MTDWARWVASLKDNYWRVRSMTAARLSELGWTRPRTSVGSSGVSGRILDLAAQRLLVAINDHGLVVEAGCSGGWWPCLEERKFERRGRGEAESRLQQTNAVRSSGSADSRSSATSLPLAERRKAAAWTPDGTDRGGADDVNERGEVVGETISEAGTSMPSLWQNGRVTDLGPSGSPGEITINTTRSSEIALRLEAPTRRTLGAQGAQSSAPIVVKHSCLRQCSETTPECPD
jgi:hypothetical protein